MNANGLIYSVADIERIAKKLKDLLERYPVMTFSGSLGAGKTTLIKELLRQCGIDQLVTSPTFTYLNQYETDDGKIFYHFDLYRINSLHDFCAAGFDEYLYAPNSVALIEWPETILPLLKERVCHVSLDYHDDSDKRIMKIECK